MVPGGQVQVESGKGSGRGAYNRGVTSTLLNRVIIALSFLGMFVAGVLSYSAAMRVDVPCRADGIVNCAGVTTSEASKLFGISVAYIGFAVYAGILALAIIRSRNTDGMWKKAATAGFWMTGVGLAFSIYLQTISVTQLREICEWCLTSACTMLILFILHGMVNQFGEEPVPEDKDEVKVRFFRTKNDMTVVAVGAVMALAAFGFTASGMTKEMNAEIPGMKLAGVTAADIMTDPNRVGGNPDAKVAIIEVADILCPACRASYDDYHKLLDKYNGKVKHYFVLFPLFNLQGHENSAVAAAAAQFAANEGKFWPFMDEAFSKSNEERVKTYDGVVGILGDIGLSTKKFKEELKGDALVDQVNNDFNMCTSKIKVSGTPTFILAVEGQPLRAYQLNGLKTALESPSVQQALK